MEKIMKKKQLARELASRTGFFIKNMEDVLDALDDIIIDSLKQAKVDNPTRIYLAKGFYVEGRRKKECVSTDPRNRSECITPEKVIPKPVFTQQFRNKLFAKPHGYEQIKRKRINAENAKARRNQMKDGDDK